MAERRRKFWGWGYEDQGPNAEQKQHMAARMAQRFNLPELKLLPTPTEADLHLRAPRIQPPDALAVHLYCQPLGARIPQLRP